MKSGTVRRKARASTSAAAAVHRLPAKNGMAAAQAGNRHLLRQGPVAPPAVEQTLRSAGHPLEAGARAEMETHFGADFSDVRVHSDARAARSAEAVNANAYTVGQDVVFGPGQYAPQSESGRELLAHELTHVVQQGESGAPAIQREEKNEGPPPPPTTPPPEQAEARVSTTLPNTLATIPFEGGRVKDMKAMNALILQIRGILEKQKDATFTVTTFYETTGKAEQAGDEQQMAQQHADGLVIMCNVNGNIPKNKFKTSTMDISTFSGSAPTLGVNVRIDQPIAADTAAAPSLPLYFAVTGIPCNLTDPTIAKPCPKETPDVFQPLPPVIVPPERSIVGSLLNTITPDVMKILSGPLALGQMVVNKIDPDVNVVKEVKNALRTVDEPSTKPPLTNQGVFADNPADPEFERRQAAMQPDAPKTAFKAFLFSVPGQQGVPQPPFDPVGTTFFFRIPAFTLKSGLIPGLLDPGKDSKK